MGKLATFTPLHSKGGGLRKNYRTNGTRQSTPPQFEPPPPHLEAQQRYFSCRTILVAIVSQNSLVLVIMGYRTSIARHVAKWGIAQMCLCEAKCQRGYRTILGECESPLTSIAQYGVSQRWYRNIARYGATKPPQRIQRVWVVRERNWQPHQDCRYFESNLLGVLMRPSFLIECFRGQHRGGHNFTLVQVPHPV